MEGWGKGAVQRWPRARGGVGMRALLEHDLSFSTTVKSTFMTFLFRRALAAIDRNVFPTSAIILRPAFGGDSMA